MGQGFLPGGQLTAVMVVPYPAGMPLLLPGEHAGESDGPALGYLSALQHLDRRFPGFSYDIHGVEPAADGTYQVMCLKDGSVR
jgi:arginine/lysine/ornithine decarboxylase